MPVWTQDQQFCEMAAAHKCGDPAVPITGEAVVEVPAIPGAINGAKGRTKLGEGAVWDHIVNRLLWIDIVKGKIFEWDPINKSNTSIDTRQPIGTVVPHTESTVVAALIKGVMVIDRKTGRIEKSLGNPEKDLPEHRWNDGKCDPQGRLWVGSMLTSGDDPPGQASLWSVDSDGTWKQHVEGVSISNGLVWSQDAKTFWWIDSPTGEVSAFNYDGGAGTVSNRRTAINHFKDGQAVNGYPDGCTIDADDNIWVAAWEGGGVYHYNPHTGELLGKYATPGAQRATSCAFGGEALDQLFITTASCGVSEAELIEQPHAGALFRLDLSQASVKGVHAPVFGGPQ